MFTVLVKPQKEKLHAPTAPGCVLQGVRTEKTGASRTRGHEGRDQPPTTPAGTRSRLTSELAGDTRHASHGTVLARRPAAAPRGAASGDGAPGTVSAAWGNSKTGPTPLSVHLPGARHTAPPVGTGDHRFPQMRKGGAGSDSGYQRN